jgi:hypothetical protein
MNAPILGPCRCQGCGAPTVWTRVPKGRHPQPAWRNPDSLRLHRCANRTHVRYNVAVGRSDANSDNMRGGHRRASTSSVATSCLEVEAP